MVDRIILAVGQGIFGLLPCLGLLFLWQLANLVSAKLFGLEWFKVDLFRLIKFEACFGQAESKAQSDVGPQSDPGEVGTGESREI
jgi:hypothetical protein